MNLRKLIFTNNNCYKTGKKMKPKGIMVHTTGANNPYLSRYVGPDDGYLGKNKYNNHWNQPYPGGRAVCPHAFIGYLKDKKGIATYQVLPWDHVGWHSGYGKNGSANTQGYIGFEICEDSLTDAKYFNSVYQEAVELCAYLCKKYNLDPLKKGVIIGHYEGHQMGIASNHGDPKHWFSRHGKSMSDFRAAVKEELRGNGHTSTSSNLYRVRKSWSDVKSQIGAYRVLSNAKAMADKNKGYKVFDSAGNVVYPTPKVVTQPKPQQSTKTWRNYINGQIVRDLQTELNKQFNAGLVVDGYMGDKTIAALRTVRRGARGNLTRIIQRRLIANGHKLTHGADGIFGAGTDKAVCNFQRANGLSIDGIVGKNTWKALFRK